METKLEKLQSEIVALDHAHGVYVEMYDRLKINFSELFIFIEGVAGDPSDNNKHFKRAKELKEKYSS